MTKPSRDQFRGCILGLAVGDALGFPAEFMSRESILARWPGGITGMVASRSHPAGTYTDDTQMTIALAEGMLDKPDGALFDVMDAVAARFVAWAGSAENDRAPGRTCMVACARLEEGSPWFASGEVGSKGCGAAMRVAPLGLLFWDDPEELVSLASSTAYITHGHPTAIAASRAAALLVSLALEGASPTLMHLTVRKWTHDGDFNLLWDRLPAIINRTPPEVALSKKGIGESWVAEEAVASAFYCYARHASSFELCLLEAANTDGDSDSIACIAGSIAGAALGMQAIPREWLDVLENRDQLIDLADRIYDAD